MKKPKFDFAVGGQAVIEGVMMRSKRFIAVAVRKKDGSIKIKDQAYQSLVQKHKWLNIPFVRGVINMFEMLFVGTKALNFSADEFVEEEESGEPKTKRNKTLDAVFLTFNVLISLAFAIFLFKFIPLYSTEWINKFIPGLEENYILYNAIDGGIKLLIFVLYIVAITFSKTIRRVFEYHGAEHKAVFNYEHDTELTPENSAKESRFHPRCGTSFIIFVFLLSIILYTFIPRHPDFVIHFARRIIVLPVIAGISYEVLKTSAKYSNMWWVKLFTVPGLTFQRLTTKEPDKSQLEVAIAALQRTLDLESQNEESQN